MPHQFDFTMDDAPESPPPSRLSALQARFAEVLGTSAAAAPTAAPAPSRPSASATSLGHDGEFPVAVSHSRGQSVSPGGVSNALSSTFEWSDPWEMLGTSPALAAVPTGVHFKVEGASSKPVVGAEGLPRSVSRRGTVRSIHAVAAGADLTPLRSNLPTDRSTGSFSLLTGGTHEANIDASERAAPSAFASPKDDAVYSVLHNPPGVAPFPASSTADLTMKGLTLDSRLAGVGATQDESRDPKACVAVLIGSQHNYCLGKIGAKGKFCLKEADACDSRSHKTKAEVELGCYYLQNLQLQGLPGPTFEAFVVDGDSLWAAFGSGSYTPSTWAQIHQLIESNLASPDEDALAPEEAEELLKQPDGLPTPAKKRQKLGGFIRLDEEAHTNWRFSFFFQKGVSITGTQGRNKDKDGVFCAS